MRSTLFSTVVKRYDIKYCMKQSYKCKVICKRQGQQGRSERGIGDDDEDGDKLPEHHDERAKCARQLEVDHVEVFREAVQDATRWRRVEERHGRVQQALYCQ